MYVLYTDDSILARPNMDEVDQAIKCIQNTKLNIAIKVYLQGFLGINIYSKHDG